MTRRLLRSVALRATTLIGLLAITALCGCGTIAPTTELASAGPALPPEGAFREFQSAVVGRNVVGTLGTFGDPMFNVPRSERLSTGLIMARDVVDMLAPLLDQAIVETEAPRTEYSFSNDGVLQMARARLTCHIRLLPEWTAGPSMADESDAPARPNRTADRDRGAVLRTEWLAEEHTWKLARLELRQANRVWRLPAEAEEWLDDF